MTTLNAWPIPDTTGHIIFVRDELAIPKGVRAFIRLDPRGRDRAKARIKDEKKQLSSFQRNQINALLTKILVQYHYSFEGIRDAALSGRYYI